MIDLPDPPRRSISRQRGIHFPLGFVLLAFGLCVPTHGQSPTPQHAIWEFRDELRLTEDQIMNLKRAALELQTRVRDLSASMPEEEARLSRMIRGRAALEAIRLQLERIARTQVEIRMADVMSARKIDEVLSDRQREHWEALQEDSRSSHR